MWINTIIISIKTDNYIDLSLRFLIYLRIIKKPIVRLWKGIYYMNTETVKRLAKAGNTTMTEFAETLNIAQNTFSTKVKRDTIKDDERKRIADALGAVYVCGFLMPDGKFISDYSDAVGMKLADDKAEIIV